MPPKETPEITGGESGANKPQPGVPKKIDDILLPKKEIHTPASAQRVNAGVLFEQQTAAAPAAPPPPTTPTEPVAPPPPPQPESIVKPLQTYRSAIESVVQQKKVSVVSIAAEEAKRRGEEPLNARPGASAKRDFGFTFAAVSGGLVLLASATALLMVIFLRPQADAPAVTSVPAPFIEVDDTQLIAIPSSAWQRSTVMGTTDLARVSTTLSLGLMARLYVAVATNTNALPPPAPLNALLGAMAPNAPAELLRSFSGEYLLGVHSYDGNQAFLIAGVDSFEAAYAGMLAWEISMQQELAPLFTRTPRPRIPEENLAPLPAPPPIFLPGDAATSSATSSAATATTSAAASSTPPQAPEPELPAFLRSQFADRVVENYDARVIQTEEGDIVLLWTFLDRSTLVITTNDATLREIVSRRTRPPVAPLD
jgi:hypothetical protein